MTRPTKQVKQALCVVCGAPSVLIEDWSDNLGRPVLKASDHCWGCLATGQADQ